jgi:hypothetical protein
LVHLLFLKLLLLVLLPTMAKLLCLLAQPDRSPLEGRLMC